jgi:integrase
MAIRHRQVRVTIYRKSQKYPFYRIAYRAEGGRIVRSFKTLIEAKNAARKAAKQVAKGETAAAALSNRDARAYRFAMKKLSELNLHLNAASNGNSAASVISLEDAIVEYAEAKRALSHCRLIEAIQKYLATTAKVQRVSVRLAATEYINQRKSLTRSDESGKRAQLSPKLAYQDGLRLDRFADNIKSDVCDLTKGHVDLFFRQHLTGLSPKSRNHYRGTLRHWFKFCVARDYLPADHRLAEAVSIKNETADSGDIEIYTPKEFQDLLATATGPLKVLLAIGGLAGLRTQELLRLDWADVWRRPGYIELSRGKAKTRQRRLVPIVDALSAWLYGHQRETAGPIWAGHEITFHEHARELAQEAGVKRKDNALRHSFISYRLAETHNEHQVAREAGTSPAMIHAHYRELVTMAEAKEWFSTTPQYTPERSEKSEATAESKA